MKHYLSLFALSIVTCVFLATLTGCYRMPDDDECSVIPTTNNPAVVGKRTESWTPGGSF